MHRPAPPYSPRRVERAAFATVQNRVRLRQYRQCDCLRPASANVETNWPVQPVPQIRKRLLQTFEQFFTPRRRAEYDRGLL